MASLTAVTGRRYIVRRSSIHGRGVFALADIPKGTRLMEYIGERISHREADRRYAAEHEHSPHTMLFSVDDKTVIDATQVGKFRALHQSLVHAELRGDRGRRADLHRDDQESRGR